MHIQTDTYPDSYHKEFQTANPIFSIFLKCLKSHNIPIIDVTSMQSELKMKTFRGRLDSTQLIFIFSINFIVP